MALPVYQRRPSLPCKLLYFLIAPLFPIWVPFVAYPAFAQNAQQVIPQKFFGAFQLDHSDNWDAYLAAKGYDEATRKQVKLPKLTRILYPKEEGTYRMMVGTGLEASRWVKGAQKNADWLFQLDKEFKGKYWDGNEHMILFHYDPSTDQLVERHTIIGSQAPPEEFVYAIDRDGNLESHIMFKGVELIHHYIRTD